MYKSIIISFLLLFSFNESFSQELVSLNRNRLHAEQAKKEKAKKEAKARQQAKARQAAANSKRQHKAKTTPKQAPTPYLYVNNLSHNFSRGVSCYGDNVTFNVNTSASDYNVKMLPSWCKLISQGAYYFTLQVDKNITGRERSGWFEVISNTNPIIITLTQDACPINIYASYNSGSIISNSYFYNIEVDAGLSIRGGQDLTMYAVAEFFDEKGHQISAADGFKENRRTMDGALIGSQAFTPNKDNQYVNIKILIPKNAFPLTKKKTKLRCRLSLFCGNNGKYIDNVGWTIPFVIKKTKSKFSVQNGW